MKYKVVSVRDYAVEAFGVPFFTRSVGEAERSFADEVNRVDENNQLNRHPEHFDLFLVGEFDSTSGLLNPLTVPTLICVGKNCVKV